MSTSLQPASLEQLDRAGDLLRHGLRRADIEGAIWSGFAIEVPPVPRRPAAFAADPVHHRRKMRPQFVAGSFVRFCDVSR